VRPVKHGLKFVPPKAFPPLDIFENEAVSFCLVKKFKAPGATPPKALTSERGKRPAMPYFWAKIVNQPTAQPHTFSSRTMIKKVFSTALFALALTALATAQRIAYVDVTAVLESLPDYQKAQEQLDKVATQWRQEIAQEQDKVKGMYSKYQAEQVLLSEEMKKTREEEILNKEKEVREMQRQKFGPEGSLFKKREELVKPIQDKVYSAIQKFAEDKGFEYVFDKGSSSGMLYADKKNDKTEDIKNLLKKG
jgi:outer membrane protein